jgi:alkylation response protein AidB-like acyl-CoA dehydrogenase
MLARSRALKPVLAERAEMCERLRRLPDETERDLHDAGLFRVVQPARVGGAELDVGIFVDVCAELAQVCPSTAWNFGNLASHHWMLGYGDPRIQDEIWDVSPDTLIATSLAFPSGKGRKVDGGWEVTGRWPLSSGVDNSDWNMLGFIVRERDDGPPVDHRFALCHRSQYEIIDTWHAVGLAGTGSKDVATTKLYVPDYRTISAWAMNGKPHAGSASIPAAVEAADAGDRAVCAVGRDAGLRAGRVRDRGRHRAQAQRHLDRPAGRRQPGDPDQGRRGERAHRHCRGDDARCASTPWRWRAAARSRSMPTSCATGATPSSRCGSVSKPLTS